jgi:hypothetical protein
VIFFLRNADYIEYVANTPLDIHYNKGNKMAKVIAGEGFRKAYKRDRCPVTNKLRYKERVEVQDALLQIMIEVEVQGNTERKERSFYMCPFCSVWHLTSQTSALTELYRNTARIMGGLKDE